jgi:glycine cleavage system aminomethyltransferase T
MGFDAEFMGRDFGDGQAEAIATRQSCCLFNYSFLARARLEGPGAVSAISRLTNRPVSDMRAKQIRYALHCDALGHAIHLTIWRVDEFTFEVFSGDRRDIDLLKNPIEDYRFTDLSNSVVMALQGPLSLEILAKSAGWDRTIALFRILPGSRRGMRVQCRAPRLYRGSWV